MVTADPMEVANLRRRAQDLTDRAQDLTRKAQILLDAATVIEEEQGLSHGHQVEIDITAPVEHISSEQKTTPPAIAAPGERLKQLIQFLKDHGPKRRSEIVKDTRIPVGTISHLLKDNSNFRKLHDGRWGAKVQHDMS